jgi:CRP-like cAMP-binding protein
LNIEAIEDREMFQILKSDLDKLYETYPKFQQFFRILAENSLAAYQQLYVNSTGFSAKERYESFSELYPSLVQCLPQRYIASYIGVTPEFFSKMMSQMQAKRLTSSTQD